MMMTQEDEEEIVRGTDVDALSSRLSCLLKGYLPEDNLLVTFVPLMARYKVLLVDSEFRQFALLRSLRKSFFNLISSRNITNDTFKMNVQSAKRNVLKSPVINRGTWLRTISIDMIINKFLQQFKNEKVQILSLGAGSDTRAFRILPKHHKNVDYFEVDFENSCKIKKYAILSSEELCKALFITKTEEKLPTNHNEFVTQSSSLESDCYHLIACDLRTLKDRKDALPSSFDWNKKTLVLSECCICYMGTEDSNNLLLSLKQNLSQGIFLVYDPMGGEKSNESRYGEVMVRNLRTRGIEMPNLMVYNTIEKQHQRFLQFGLCNSNLIVCDMRFVYENWIPRDEIFRVSKLEMLDELEELNLINSHYALILGWWGFEFRSNLKTELP